MSTITAVNARNQFRGRVKEVVATYPESA